MGSRTDPAATAAALGRALPLQARDALALALAAGTLPGPQGVALASLLRGMAAEELADVERLAGRLAALGTAQVLEPPSVELPRTLPAALRRLAGMQRESLAALVEAIPADADDLEGEATEHLLEHVIHRKRASVELLERAGR